MKISVYTYAEKNLYITYKNVNSMSVLYHSMIVTFIV